MLWPALFWLSGFCFGKACGLESWSFPDFREDDKQKHFVAGMAIAGLTDVYLRSEYPSLNRWERAGWEILATSVVAVAKEISDDRAGPAKHTADPADALATVIGGGLVVAFTFSWSW